MKALPKLRGVFSLPYDCKADKRYRDVGMVCSSSIGGYTGQEFLMAGIWQPDCVAFKG